MEFADLPPPVLWSERQLGQFDPRVFDEFFATFGPPPSPPLPAAGLSGPLGPALPLSPLPAADLGGPLASLLPLSPLPAGGVGGWPFWRAL